MPNIPYPEYKADVQYCKDIQRQYGKNYFFATRIFPRALREATHILYAFFRIPDEFVDSPEYSDTQAQKEIQQWEGQWKETQSGKTTTQPVLRATHYLFEKYSIPDEYANAFFKAMKQDLTKERYHTYQELEEYMYGSASVVGLMMSYVIGFSDKQALTHAEQLGHAMQLTNFLRDIKEDIVERNRIYIPQDDLERFKVTEEDIVQHRWSPNMEALMKFQVKRAEQLYKDAEQGIPMLNTQGRVAVRLGSRLYEALLKKLLQQGWNPYTGRASTSLWEKIILTPSALREKRWSSSVVE
jgi:15-cis-phytoene synthase